MFTRVSKDSYSLNEQLNACWIEKFGFDDSERLSQLVEQVVVVRVVYVNRRSGGERCRR